MEEKQLTQIEINGIKMEVDLRTAKRIDEFKVGDNVKILRKDYSSHRIDAGVIIDFVNFKELPTIQLAVFSTDYNGTKMEILNFNSNSKDFEMMPVSEHELVLEKNKVIDKMENEINDYQRRIDEVKAKKDYFLKHFGKYFKQDCN